MSENKTVPSGTPTKASWIVAGMSVAFVLVVLYAGEMISRGYYYARLQNSFRQTFSASADLTFAVDNPEFAELFTHEQRQIKLLRPLISLLSQDDSAKAAEYWKRQTPPKTPLHAQLTKLMSDLERNRADSEAQRTDLEKLSALETAKSQQYVALKSDFRSYLGLEAKNRPELPVSADTAENSICTFYHGGMLAGMPVLTSLPDEIADFHALGQYFTLAKSGMPAPSADAAARDFATLHERGRALQAECDDIKMKTAELIAAQEKGEEAAKQIFADSRETVRKILLSLATPEIDGQSVLAYDLFRTSLSKWGYNLPELWV